MRGRCDRACSPALSTSPTIPNSPKCAIAPSSFSTDSTQHPRRHPTPASPPPRTLRSSGFWLRNSSSLPVRLRLKHHRREQPVSQLRLRDSGLQHRDLGRSRSPRSQSPDLHRHPSPRPSSTLRRLGICSPHHHWQRCLDWWRSNHLPRGEHWRRYDGRGRQRGHKRFATACGCCGQPLSHYSSALKGRQL